MIASRFFITGLPRSRTCWLANFLTNGDTFCLHAGLLSVGGDLAKLPERLDSLGKPIVGDADPSLLAFPIFEQSVELFPGAKWVFVCRDPAEAHAAHNKAFPQLALPLNVIEELRKRLDHFAAVLGGVVVDFDDLTDESVCNELHLYCTGRPMDIERWRMLSKMRIEADQSQWVKSMSPETRAKIAAVTGDELKA